jgi:hypothetical protein
MMAAAKPVRVDSVTPYRSLDTRESKDDDRYRVYRQASALRSIIVAIGGVE